MAVTVVPSNTPQLRFCTCPMCNSLLSYLKEDVKEGTTVDAYGAEEPFLFVYCPECDWRVELPCG